MPQQTINITDAEIVYIGLFIIYVLPVLITLLVNIVSAVRSHKNHRENNGELVAIRNYICDKGIDDFNDECDQWIEKGYITQEAYDRLEYRYYDLSALHANGRRERHWKKVQGLEKHEEDRETNNKKAKARRSKNNTRSTK